MGSPEMTTRSLPGDPPLTLRLRTSARARRITLRVSSLDGRVTLTRPAGTPEREALAFASEKADWLRAQIARREASRRPELGGTIPLAGRPHEIGAGAPGVGEGVIRVAPGRPVGPQVAAILKQAARDRLASRGYPRSGPGNMKP